MSKRKRKQNKMSKVDDRIKDNIEIDDEDEDDFPRTCEDVFGPCMGPSCPGFCTDCFD